MKKISINLDKIDMNRVRQDSKGNGRFIDLVEIDTPNDKYGNDFMVVQSVTKEERENGVKGPIIGNGKDTSKTRG